MTNQCNKQFCRDRKSRQISLKEAVEECSCVTKNSTVKLNENRASWELSNKNETKITVTSIDSCIEVLKDKKKCDFMVSWEKGPICYIELKGSDHKSGCEQLLATVEHFSSLHAGKKRICYLAANPPASSSLIQAKMKEFSKKKVSFSVDRKISI
ncbi:hypothetical protein [Desulfovibrio piger]